MKILTTITTRQLLTAVTSRLLIRKVFFYSKVMVSEDEKWRDLDDNQKDQNTHPNDF